MFVYSLLILSQDDVSNEEEVFARLLSEGNFFNIF